MHSRFRAVALVAAATGLAAPAAAQADSIAYVKDGDVWLSTSDGARQYRVTAKGGYSDVTQADDGTMVALHGVRLHRLDRGGHLLADFDTPVSDTRAEGARVFYGPFDPALSPSGQRLSYTYYYVSKGTSPGCIPPTCMTTVTEGGTGYSHADRQTAWDEPGLGRHSGWRNATWLDDDTTMISDPTHLPNTDVLLDNVGDTGVPIMEWFSDNATERLGAGEMTRGRSKLAFQAGQGDKEMRVYRLPGDYPALPELCYGYTGATVGAPTWSPDSRQLAWAEPDGVKVVDVPEFTFGCTTDGATVNARLLIPGATQPDWGPAPVPPGPGVVPDKNGDDQGTNCCKQPDVPGSGRLRIAGVRAGKALRVTVVAHTAGELKAAARSRGRTVATAKAHAVAAGRRTVTLRLTAAGRRQLRRAARTRVKVTVRLAGAKATKTVTIKRSAVG